MSDPIDQLAAWIAAYRLQGRPPQEMQSAALATFPSRTATDYAVALVRANRARSVAGAHG